MSTVIRKENNNVITIAPELADIDLADNYQQLVDTTNTSLQSVFNTDTVPASELQATMDYRNAFKQGDVITAVNNFFNNSLNGNYINQADFSLDAVLFWYQKATYSNKEITAYKNQNTFYNSFILPNYIPGASLFADNVVNSVNHNFNYFNVVSDSIGVIANSKFIQLDNTLPLFDVSQQYYGVPIPIAASTDSKISSITRNVMYNLSQKTTTVMRRNLLNIGYSNTLLQDNYRADATTSHGCNLINDLPTFIRINKMVDQLKNSLATVFDQAKVFSFVQYLNNIGNVTALNLRDIFPVSPKDDRDFTVITSAESAAAAAAAADQEYRDTQAAQQIENQQYQLGIDNSVAATGGINGTVGALAHGVTLNANADGTISSTGRATVFGYNDPADNGIGTSIPGTKGQRYNTDNPDIIGIAVPFHKDEGVTNAIYAGAKGGDLFLVQVPGQPPAIMPVVDNGPATSTGNAVDFTYGAAQMNGFASGNNSSSGSTNNVTIRPLTPSEAAAVNASYPTLYTGRAGSTASQQAANLVSLTAPTTIIAKNTSITPPPSPAG